VLVGSSRERRGFHTAVDDAVSDAMVATSHEGAGVAPGPVTGRLVAQLYCGEPPVADPAPFDPDRFGR
jgi:D-hydroxyproline dehydrogenase subunit beta